MIFKSCKDRLLFLNMPQVSNQEASAGFLQDMVPSVPQGLPDTVFLDPDSSRQINRSLRTVFYFEGRV